MSSPALIEFSTLLEPVPGDDPAGVPVPLVVRQKMDLARKDEEPHPDDPTQAPIPKKSDWPQIINTATDLLQNKGKDLNLAARMTEALARQDGFAGLRDGLHLLADLVEYCWDRLHPTPDEGESMEVRAGPFHWLSESDRGARFPTSVRDLPLVMLDDVPRSWLDQKRAQDGKNELTPHDFERATPYNTDIGEDIEACLAELSRLDVTLGEKLGPDAPTLQDLRQAVEDCQALLNNVLRLQPGAKEAPSGEPTSNGSEVTASVHGGGDVTRVASTRAELYGQLSRIANMLEKLEPHSPIPALIRRAVELGKMPFRELIRELIRDGNQLAELRREFGLKDDEGPPPG